MVTKYRVFHRVDGVDKILSTYDFYDDALAKVRELISRKGISEGIYRMSVHGNSTHFDYGSYVSFYIIEEFTVREFYCDDDFVLGLLRLMIPPKLRASCSFKLASSANVVSSLQGDSLYVYYGKPSYVLSPSICIPSLHAGISLGRDLVATILDMPYEEYFFQYVAEASKDMFYQRFTEHGISFHSSEVLGDSDEGKYRGYLHSLGKSEFNTYMRYWLKSRKDIYEEVRSWLVSYILG